MKKKITPILNSVNIKSNCAAFILIFILTILSYWALLILVICKLLNIEIVNIDGFIKADCIIVAVCMYQAHNAFYGVMYDENIMPKITDWIKNHSIKWLMFLTLGYASTFLLDYYYIRDIYNKYDLQYHRSNITQILLVDLPIINILAYLLYIHKVKREEHLNESYKFLFKLFLKGQMMTYITRSQS
jgi:hypothetical protein